MKIVKPTTVVSFVIAALAIIVFSCKKDEVYNKAELTTTALTYITEASAVSGGIITSDGGTNVTERGRLVT